MTHICKFRHRKKDLENFRKFISQERHIRILIESAYRLYSSTLFRHSSLYENKVRYHNITKKNLENRHLCFSLLFEW